MSINRRIKNKRINKVLIEIKQELKKLYGNKLVDLILYGSYARGEENQESDIDIALILKGQIRPYEEIKRVLKIACNLDLKYNVVLDIHPISDDFYKSKEFSFYSTIQEEGISIWVNQK